MKLFKFRGLSQQAGGALGAVQTIVSAGLTQTYAVPLASEVISSGKAVWLHVKNANASPCVVTIVDPFLTPGGSTPVNPTVSVPGTTGDKMILLRMEFNNSSSFSVQFSVTTSVSVAVLTV